MQQQSFKLKGSLFTLSVLQLENLNLQELDRDLAEKIKLAPKFFYHTPIVIDIQKVDSQSIDFLALKQILEKHNLIPVGIKGGQEFVQMNAKQAGFAIMGDSSTSSSEKRAPTQRPQNLEIRESQAATLVSKEGTRLITSPIRSGQQVYAQGGDLVVVSSVSSGAELLADGNIHVYGTLRGRALAGVNGNNKARIFCHHLEAELVAIAGEYKVFEHIPNNYPGAVQIHLKDNRLIIESLEKNYKNIEKSTCSF
ncbi:MAG: septum site-determining protein MinC [Gammaproteobacteria bacterium]|jgi:septum site-determining protein MinC|nr:septum site-determining protein MinC [Gammaproteobacteria bacterium]